MSCHASGVMTRLVQKHIQNLTPLYIVFHISGSWMSIPHHTVPQESDQCELFRTAFEFGTKVSSMFYVGFGKMEYAHSSTYLRSQSSVEPKRQFWPFLFCIYCWWIRSRMLKTSSTFLKTRLNWGGKVAVKVTVTVTEAVQKCTPYVVPTFLMLTKHRYSDGWCFRPPTIKFVILVKKCVHMLRQLSSWTPHAGTSIEASFITFDYEVRLCPCIAKYSFMNGQSSVWP